MSRAPSVAASNERLGAVRLAWVAAVMGLSLVLGYASAARAQDWGEPASGWGPNLVPKAWASGRDIPGWNTSGSSDGVQLSSDPVFGFSGHGVATVTNTAATAGSCVLNDSPDAVATTTPGTHFARLR